MRGKPIITSECCWGSLDDEKRAELIRGALTVFKKYGVGFVAHALQYCGFVEEDWNCHGTYDAMIRTMMVSVADLVILPIQDVCHFGADTRMNVPGKAQGNWAYRITKNQLDAVDWNTYRKWNDMYGRNKKESTTIK